MNSTVENIYKLLYKGMIDKDAVLLNEILDGDFCLIHMTRLKRPKEEFINAIQSGVLNYYSAEHINIEAQENGNNAELIGKSIVMRLYSAAAKTLGDCGLI